MKLKDLKKTPEEIIQQRLPILGPVDEYPYGTSITLDQDTLEKLRVNHEDWEVGDIFEITGMWRVCKVVEHEGDLGKTKCVTLQALMLGAEEEPDEAGGD